MNIRNKIIELYGLEQSRIDNEIHIHKIREEILGEIGSSSKHLIVPIGNGRAISASIYAIGNVRKEIQLKEVEILDD